MLAVMFVLNFFDKPESGIVHAKHRQIDVKFDGGFKLCDIHSKRTVARYQNHFFACSECRAYCAAHSEAHDAESAARYERARIFKFIIGCRPSLVKSYVGYDDCVAKLRDFAYDFSAPRTARNFRLFEFGLLLLLY